MLPIIAIVGRPNVGKSTLFNRLTKTRQAIVSNLPGLTRDRQYGTFKLEPQEAIIIDTGGINQPESPLETLMSQQTQQALKETEIIIFLVDAKVGLTEMDKVLAKRLRKLNKPIIVTINKSEGKDETNLIAEFFSLGFHDCLPIAAEHNLGIYGLKEVISKKLPAPFSPFPPTNQTGIKIAFIGKPNVGKSTLVNQLLGEQRVIAHDLPGTTRDSIQIEFTRHNQKYMLIDTAGIRRKSKVQAKIEKFSVIKTLQTIAATDVAVLLIDATENITEQDLKILALVLAEGKALVIAINKWDKLTQHQRKKLKDELKRRLIFLDFVEIYFISALYGTRTGKLFNSINKAYLNSTKPLNTSTLNRVLELALQNLHPPLVKGREIKLRYVHIGHYQPPTFIIHGNRAEQLPTNYQRYLEKFFRQQLKLTGTPLQLIFKNS